MVNKWVKRHVLNAIIVCLDDSQLFLPLLSCYLRFVFHVFCHIYGNILLLLRAQFLSITNTFCVTSNDAKNSTPFSVSKVWTVKTEVFGLFTFLVSIFLKPWLDFIYLITVTYLLFNYSLALRMIFLLKILQINQKRRVTKRSNEYSTGIALSAAKSKLTN